VIDPKVLDDLARTLADSVPPGLRELRRDMEKNARAALESAFARLNLVSREEFEIQAGVLARTRAKLETLEKHLAELEAELSKKGGKKK
jgi:BMFP domain-containing protein YqiC